MAFRKGTLFLPGEDVCGCVPIPIGTAANNLETFVELCPCMYVPDEESERTGEMICVQCGKKIHSCGCTLNHSTECEIT